MANIHSFESLAAVDGEGIRFDVFFSGCPLRCAYCHNPDTFPFEEFKARGFNMIRLGFTWDKMEPKPENYNEK